MKLKFLFALPLFLAQPLVAADLDLRSTDSICSFTTTVTFNYQAWYFRESLHPMVTQYTCNGGEVRTDYDGARPADIEQGYVVLQNALTKVLAKFEKKGLNVKSLSASASSTNVKFSHMKPSEETMSFSGVVGKG